jgi:hypothetical protein
VCFGGVPKLNANALVESGGKSEHMSEMRKYSSTVALLGRRGVGGNLPMVKFAAVPQISCRHFGAKADVHKAVVDGFWSINLFPDAHSAARCLEPEGLRADWIKVGGDLRHAMTIWSTQERPKHEREET